mmetsp:Transcript_12578/g.37106  ORF Transcript_12578/g.37106 Transcript_12578/m.37106 type:complete len:93 (-) Transcript_12578:433-711(-)
MFGKADVVDESIWVTEDEEGSQGANDYHISFNKYSGICEWQNDAIFLWVNIASPDADVVNDFLDGGKQKSNRWHSLVVNIVLSMSDFIYHVA